MLSGYFAPAFLLVFIVIIVCDSLELTVSSLLLPGGLGRGKNCSKKLSCKYPVMGADDRAESVTSPRPTPGDHGGRGLESSRGRGKYKLDLSPG